MAATHMESSTLANSNSNSPTPEQQQLQQQQQQQQQAQKKQEELERVIQEQASLIESLQADKVGIEKSFASLKSDHERITKDNGILRKAVTIQEERRLHLEQEVKANKLQSEERIRGLEQVILTLRYHLQASQSNVVANDFMHQQRPPDVY
jgi:GAF domain-containing protein